MVATSDELLTVKEAAAIVKVSPYTVYRWIAAGRLRAVRYSPRVVRVRRSDIEAVTVPDSGSAPGSLVRPSWNKEKLLAAMGRIGHKEAEDLRRAIGEAKTFSPPIDL